jgi:hypothetical protein
LTPKAFCVFGLYFILLVFYLKGRTIKIDVSMPGLFFYCYFTLKGPWHEIFCLWLFSSNNSPLPPIHGLIFEYDIEFAKIFDETGWAAVSMIPLYIPRSTVWLIPLYHGQLCQQSMTSMHLKFYFSRESKQRYSKVKANSLFNLVMVSSKRIWLPLNGISVKKKKSTQPNYSTIYNINITHTKMGLT